ncbi:Laminin subunit beta-3 [Acipenser ruthenus]|uniref:Laminin subunit beta-3 n=1 Tax=Acipenser ruthenus TaxID=7906 RepID=A0A444V2C7_ACIRT|nr:Laminin subunit beta-3 [Acipenser ruthenus]
MTCRSRDEIVGSRATAQRSYLGPATALSSLALAQTDCSQGACYPETGDLLIGRANRLRASSTCGLAGPEVFCTPLGQWQMKCCPCDSRTDSSRNSHRIENAFSQAGPLRWWQSQKGVEDVIVQLDLDGKFQLSDLILDFKGPRPEAMVIERSTDFGKTWKPFQYMASDCHASFPHISTSAPQSLQDPHCQTLPPTDSRLYLDQRVQFNLLEPLSSVDVSDCYKINNGADFTNMRVQFTKLPRLPRRGSSRVPDAFYALKEIQVQGSCFCNGHANRCVPSANELDRPEVFSTCACQHNTAGQNCERCAELYNDQPWRPAEEGDSYQCKKCDCNNHSDRCHFDPAVFEGSGGVSGGVCDDCKHQTTGQHCEQCRPRYYRNPLRDISQPDACLRCDCSSEGSEGLCEQSGGRCICKAHVEGPRCDRCRAGFYGLSAADPQGCKECPCSLTGSRGDRACDPQSGRCFCLPNVIGQRCEMCAPDHWNFRSGRGCESCNCDPRNSYNQNCDQQSGQCQCRPGFGGRTCSRTSECPDNTYGDLRTRCTPCDCDVSGTARGGCDKTTGECICRIGVTGRRCDRCQRGHCNQYPACKQCHPCFQSLDSELQRTSSLQSVLSTQAKAVLGGFGAENWGPNIVDMETTLGQIRRILESPLPSESALRDASARLQSMRQTVRAIDPNQALPDRSPVLNREIADLVSILERLSNQYSTKKTQLENVAIANPDGAYSTIRTAFQQSGEAVRNAAGSQGLTDQAAKTRGEAERLEGRVQEDNRLALERLDNQLGTRPNLTPTAGKVCGSTRSTPCTPRQCDGALCPGPGAPPCGDRGDCRGALPLGNKAWRDAEKSESRLAELNAQIRHTAQQIKDTEQAANGVRINTDRLANQLSQARTELERDVQETRAFISRVRDFLSDPKTDPAVIQQVSEQVLSMKLPGSLGEVKGKVDQMKAIAATLPDISKVLDRTRAEIDSAKQLLQEAEEARDRAAAVEEKVFGVVDDLGSAQTLLGEAGVKVKDTGRIVEDIKSKIPQIQGKLALAESSVEGVGAQLGVIKPQIAVLKELLDQNARLAGQTDRVASQAHTEATSAGQDLATLEQQYALLKEKLGDSAGGAGVPEERLGKLQEQAGRLVQDTADMLRRIAGKESSLLLAAEELEQKVLKLDGLEEKVAEIRANIQKAVHLHSNCL